MTSAQHSMQVVILAGGLGTNLRPITEQIPKPMVPVQGNPFLYYQLEYLWKQGLKDVLLLTGYLAHQIEDYFKDGLKMELNISYSREDEPLGTGGALLHAESLLEDQFLLINGDSFLPFDYQKFIARFQDVDKQMLLSILSQEGNSTGVNNNIAYDKDSGLVRTYDKSGKLPNLNYVDAGVVALKKGVLSIFPKEGGILSLEKIIYSALIEQNELMGYPTDQRFYDIGTPQRLKEFEKYVEHDHLKNAL